MKRILTAVLAIALIAAMPLTVFAAGKLTSMQENCFTADKYSTTTNVYARVENNGDKAAMYSSGLAEWYDADGNVIVSTEYPHIYGEVLQPGEYAYVHASAYPKGEITAADVDDYVLTLTPKSAADRRTVRIPCTTEWLPDCSTGAYSTADRMQAAFTNDTDEVLYNVHVVFALLDDDGNILAMDDVSIGYNQVGVTPGSSLIVHSDLAKDDKEAYELKGFVPTHVDAYAYVDIKN